MKVLPGEIQSHRGIPARAQGIFLAERVDIFIQRQLFVYRLKLIDAAVFLFPLALGVEKPVFDARVTQLQSLGKAVVIGVPCAFCR